jgi:hypothetical protein
MGRLNKPAREGYTYRSPGQTNARDVTPNLREDVMASQSADADRIRRGLDTSETRPQNRAQVQNAAGRAITRSLGRAGLAGLAGEAGYAIGKKLNEETGAGKKLIDKTVGPSIDRAVNSRDKVELSKEAKERISAGELEEKEAPAKPRKRAAEGESPEGKMRPGRNEEIDDDTRENAGGYKRGGAVKSAKFMSFSKKGKPAGMKSVTKMASGGSFRASANGIAQRGKTRGKMV